MIVDILKNSNLYDSVHCGFNKGFDFIKKCIAEDLPVGKYEIDGDNVYAFVQAYEAKPDVVKSFEAHKKYIDIQFIVDGNELIYYNHIDTLSVTTEYNSESDFLLLDGDSGTPIKLTAGSYAIFFPEDAHKPGIAPEIANNVKKIVVKIKA